MSRTPAPSLPAMRLLDHIRPRQAEMTALLERLVLAESPSSEAKAQREAQAILSAALEARGFRPRRWSGRCTGGAILASPRGRKRDKPLQLLLGHSDTVWPLGTLDAFPVRIEKGRLYGPGCYDMKAGLVQGLFAVDALRAVVGEDPPVTPVFLINADEEIGSRETERWIRAVARCADRAFVLEPSLGSSGDLKTARKGVGRFTIVVKGKAAHAGLDPESGASAILELAHVVQALFALNDRERGITVNVGTIDGGVLPNVVAPESRAVADVRVPTLEDAQAIEAAIHALEPTTPGTRLMVEGGIGRPPMERTPGNRALWRRARQAADVLGIELGEGTAGGGSDGNTTSLYVPTLDGLGAVGEGAHARNEQLVIGRMVERAALLACLLAQPPIHGDVPKEDP